MYLAYDERLQIHPQDDGFLSKPVWDFARTPAENYPLLLNYHPLVIYRHQVCKQADVLLAFFGLSHDLGPLESWGLDIHNRHLVTDPQTGKTNLEGIYAIGDIATYPHKRKLILTGFGEAAQAAQAIRHQLYPDAVFHQEHSTTSGVLGFS
jgi:hypothetical protein